MPAPSPTAAPAPDPVAAADSAASGPGGQAPADAACVDCPLQDTHFVKLRLLDEDGQPLADEMFRITAPDGTVFTGLTDAKGFGELQGLPAGQCQFEFPLLDRDTWEPKP